MMITGDHPKTAAVIAAELGITSDGCAVTGAELQLVALALLRKVEVEPMPGIAGVRKGNVELKGDGPLAQFLQSTGGR